MDGLTLSLLGVLEVALLLAVLAVLLKRANTRLQRRLVELEQTAKPQDTSDSFESIASGYLPYLEKQIIDTRSRLELNEIETGGEDELATALERRLDFLEREKHVVELCNDYPKRRWEHVDACFSPPPAEPDAALEAEEQLPQDDESPADALEAANRDESVTQLAGILSEQGEALGSFRQVFEVIKKQPDPHALEEMEKQLGQLERQYREAGTCIRIMEQENDRLQRKVEQGNRRLDNAEAEKNESVADLQNQVGKQKRSISDLNHLIDGLQLEADKAEELQAKLDQFDLATREMNMCIQIMEEENEFLREQVQALLKLNAEQAANAELENQRARVETLEREIDSLQAALKEKDDRLTALQSEFASMEEQYLALYEQAQS